MSKTNEAKARYDAKSTIGFYMKLNKKTDADVIKKLQSVSSKQGYVKDLIRRDLKDQE